MNIFVYLQSNELSKAGKSGQRTSIMDLQAIKTLKSDIPGNNRCVDCDAPSKSKIEFSRQKHISTPYFPS